MDRIVLFKGDKIVLGGVLCVIDNGLHLLVPSGYVRVEVASEDGSTIKIVAKPA